ncbi:WbuC family cupin fold metalloprotein [Verrucomicrobiota bacterium]
MTRWTPLIVFRNRRRNRSPETKGYWSDGVMEPEAVVFSGSRLCEVDRAVIDELKARAAARADGHARLCLHGSEADAVHEMIIVHPKRRYVQPHRHDTQAESFLAIEGAMLVVLFDGRGGVTRQFRMAAEAEAECFLCRLPPGQFHTMIPLSDPVVFLETTSGPFNADTHNTFASWAPEPGDRSGVERFVRDLLGDGPDGTE